MNFNRYILLVITVFLGLLSCEDELNIEPVTEKSSTNFYTSEKELESAVQGVYAQLQHQHLYGLDLIGVGEISGEDSFEEIAANDGGRFGQLDDFSTNPGNDLVAKIWQYSYRGIQRANTVLNRIDAIEYESAAIKTNRIGEMKFIRALLYYNLVRLYGDVPLVIEETESPSDFFGQGRNSATAVYAQIETDLSDAIQELSPSKQSGKPTKWSAQALLGDVQLTQANFSGALTNLEPVVDSGAYALAATTGEIFGVANEGNSEVVFEVQFTSGIINADKSREGSPAAAQFRPSGTTANAKGHNLPSQAFVNSFEADDTRATDYIDVDTEANPFYFTTKYEVSETGANDSGSNYIVIRYADVVLKYAEALNENNRTGDAIIQLNSIRTRAGLTPTTATTKEEVRQAIRQERRYELIGEGHRWFDLKRYGTAVSVMNTFFANNGITVTIDESKLILPIPQSQIDTDAAITQNPGY